jgi:hypothetical protein
VIEAAAHLKLCAIETALAVIIERMISPWLFAAHDRIHHRIDEVRLVALARVIRLTALTTMWMAGIAHWILSHQYYLRKRE